MRQAADPRSGFTLLEVLVAVAVAGLVYAAVASGLRLATQVRAKQAALRKDSWALADGWQAARRVLAAMDPGSSARPGMFTASANRVTFTAVLPDGPGQLVDASLRVDDSNRLVLHWTPRGSGGAGGERTLAGGVAALALGYRAAGAMGAWQPDWNGPGLPGLVRLSVAWTDHARRPWPPIIAGPKFTVPRG